MKTYLFFAITDSMLLLCVAFYLSLSNSLFLLAPLLVLVLMACFLMVLALLIGRVFENGRDLLSYAALAVHVAVAALALYAWQHESYIDIAFQDSLAQRNAIVLQLTDDRISDKRAIFADWEPYHEGYWSRSHGVSLTVADGTQYVFFAKTSGIWDQAGFLYIAKVDASPHCLSASEVTSEIKPMDDHWYWIVCASD